jgi:hypothetical protein
VRAKYETTHACEFTMLAICTTIIAVAVHPARAQVTDAAAAQAVGAAFLRAKEAGDWKSAAGFLDLEPLARERGRAVEMARQQREMPPTTVEQLMQMDPEMPRVVAEYEVKRMNVVRNVPNFLEMQFGVGNADSLLALPMETVAQHWLEAHDERWSFRLAMRLSNCAKVVPDTAGMPHPSYHVIGTVVNDTLAYMLFDSRGMYARAADAMHWDPPEIVRLIRMRGTWWVLPTSESSGGLVGLAMNCSPSPSKRPD